MSLNIVRDSYPNRFYPIASLLFYKVVDLFSIDLVNHIRKHQVLVQQLLRLLATFASNISTFNCNIENHFDKNIILTDISSVCLKVVE